MSASLPGTVLRFQFRFNFDGAVVVERQNKRLIRLSAHRAAFAMVIELLVACLINRSHEPWAFRALLLRCLRPFCFLFSPTKHWVPVVAGCPRVPPLLDAQREPLLLRRNSLTASAVSQATTHLINASLPRSRLLARATKILPLNPQPSHHSLVNTSRLIGTNCAETEVKSLPG